MNVAKHGSVVEQSPKGKWRVITRACNSGRALKVWFDHVDLDKADLLAKGIVRGSKNES